MGKLVDVPNLAGNAHYGSATGVGEIRLREDVLVFGVSSSLFSV